MNQHIKLFDPDTQKNTINEELKREKYRDLEVMVYRLQLTYDVIIDILDVRYISGSSFGYTIPPGVYEISDINMILKSLLFKEVKLFITIDDIRLRSNLTNNKTIRFTKKIFYTILGFVESHSGPLGDIKEFFQLITGSYRSEKPINITGIDKVHLKAACINGSILNGI